ncbi:MAG: diacylglycerol kinase family protein [Bacillota bacterium]|jgi:diacylglycerol kinase family enzyme
MKNLLIFNPGSHSGTSRRRFRLIQKLLQQHQIEVDYRITSSLADACRFSQEGNRAGYEMIIAVGGDGTINQVVNGFFDRQSRRIAPHTKMGVIYTGTSPDFCKSYRIPIEAAEAVATLSRQYSRSIEIGKITYLQQLDPSLINQPLPEDICVQTGYFACCANIGIGAALARAANGGFRKRFGDQLGTFLALLKTLSSYRPGDLVGCVDGKHFEIKNLFNLSIGKTYFIASGIKVNHDLQPDDHRFYHLTVRNLNGRNLWSLLPQIYSGRKFANTDTIALDYCRTIEIYGNNLNPEIEFDGDPMGFLPCRIETAVEKLDLICEE